jgi:hypothetical protein
MEKQKMRHALLLLLAAIVVLAIAGLIITAGHLIAAERMIPYAPLAETSDDF